MGEWRRTSRRCTPRAASRTDVYMAKRGLLRYRARCGATPDGVSGTSLRLRCWSCSELRPEAYVGVGVCLRAGVRACTRSSAYSNALSEPRTLLRAEAMSTRRHTTKAKTTMYWTVFKTF